ncbi:MULTISPECIES: hypothetical protein [unclassified Aureimonas]|uniref:hypothetical protein n=1 Tax=unclassified Aureimonas TaxID=2615206 RepID=UPI0011DF855B|nr:MULTISPECIES: hypothetical protein [unclassified Aureimonas]
MSTRTPFDRLAILALAGLVSAGCSTSGRGPAPAPASSASLPASAAQVATAGSVPDYCPPVALREGTAILRKGAGDSIDYVASITGTTRSCRERDGQYLLEVAVTGRVVPGPAAKGGTVNLPVRVAIVDNGKLVYSQLGQQGVLLDSSGGAVNFTYVDRAVRFPKPTGRTLVIYAGFDEGPAPAGAKPAGAKTASR